MEEKNTDFDTEEIMNEEKEEKFLYKNIISQNKNSRAFSVASLASGILSVVFCFLPVLGIILSLLSVVLSVISRRVLGYFDKLSIAGLVSGIFGFVFGTGYSILQAVIINTNLFG